MSITNGAQAMCSTYWVRMSSGAAWVQATPGPTFAAAAAAGGARAIAAAVVVAGEAAAVAAAVAAPLAAAARARADSDEVRLNFATLADLRRD